jgi:hypothetical protein
MAHKYHSRTPEEHREFLEKMAKKGVSSHRKRNIFFYINLIFVLFVILIYSKLSENTNKKTSEKINYQNTQFYSSASEIQDDDYIHYFVFYKSTDSSQKEFEFESQFRILTQDGKECFVKNNGKLKINAKSTSDYISMKFDKNTLTPKLTECTIKTGIGIHSIPSVFRIRKLFQTEITFQEEGKDKLVFVIPKDKNLPSYE